MVAYDGYGAAGTCDSTVAGSTPGLALLGNNLGQVVHTHVPLLPSSKVPVKRRIGVARIFDWGSCKFSPLTSFTLDVISHS